jgi:hypothetical protein
MAKIEEATAKLAEAIADLVRAVVAERFDPERLRRGMVARLQAMDIDEVGKQVVRRLQARGISDSRDLKSGDDSRQPIGDSGAYTYIAEPSTGT